MISRAVIAWPFFDANAVYGTSATSASEISRFWSSSQIACGQVMGVQADSPMAAIAARILGSIRTVTEKQAPPRRIAPRTLPGSGCPQLRRPAATGTAAKVFHLHSNRQRLTAHVDRGLAAGLAVSGCCFAGTV